MSPRAAWRLEGLGLPPVYDYVAGKMDWLSFGMPHEGEALLAADVACREVPTCGPDEDLSRVRARLAEPGSSFCAVINQSQVVLGLLRGEALTSSPESRAGDAMDFGIFTVRPAEEVGPLLERMSKARVETMLLTRSDATLYGLLVAEEARQALNGGRA